MSRAVLSLGSNLGDRLGFLRLAVEGFADSLVAVSPVYETAPWGVTDQPEFLNAVIVVADPAADAWSWLRRGQELERQAERQRGQRWGPRTLDVDVVTVDFVHSDHCADSVRSGRIADSVRSEHPDLLLPHPGTPSRATVLIPWLAIEPDAHLPGYGPVAALRDALAPEDVSGVRLRPDLHLHP